MATRTDVMDRLSVAVPVKVTGPLATTSSSCGPETVVSGAMLSGSSGAAGASTTVVDTWIWAPPEFS